MVMVMSLWTSSAIMFGSVLDCTTPDTFLLQFEVQSFDPSETPIAGFLPKAFLFECL